jgi:hypothetical protein
MRVGSVGRLDKAVLGLVPGEASPSLRRSLCSMAAILEQIEGNHPARTYVNQRDQAAG